MFQAASMMLRQASAWQLVAAFVLHAGLNGPQSAASNALYACALCTLACIPVNDYFDKPRSQGVTSVVLLAGLGRLVAGGRASPYIGAAVTLLLGLLIHFTPNETAALYEFRPETITPHTISLLRSLGATIVCTGVFLATLVNRQQQQPALALFMTTGTAFSLKWAYTEADALLAPKTGGLLAAALQAVLATLALLATP